ncbi:MAG: YkgJ family cysteine cluster protein [Peptococcaceae bacterium]|jgi:hypothetical protein|nr:MAG: YkgJ family cysteine cluster protein [Peptococcaceae bacterium]
MKETLAAGDKFKFSCHKGLSCFGQCCRNVNIFLTPYDVLRLKNRLELSSEEFLKKHTTTLISQISGLPVVALKMQDDENRSCPFITPEGCLVYTDRPWSCRMYPLDMESEEKYNFITDRSFCLGLNENQEWVVNEWFLDQGINDYEDKEALFKELSANIKLLRQKVENDKIVQMFHMACYDLDKFRRFVFESRFLDTFDIEQEVVEKIKTDELELMKLGFKWINFGMVDKKALKIKDEVLQDKKRG